MSHAKPDFIRDLISRMTLQDKAGQMNLLSGNMDATGSQISRDFEEKIQNSRCGAVLNIYTQDATRRLQEMALATPLGIPLIFGYDVIHGHRTIFPIPLALACTWNLGLIEGTARFAAAEAAADGLHWVYSPMVDISLDARWGRVAEGAGEDPWLGSKIAAAMVRGYQGDNLTNSSVAACMKHFALYGAPRAGRDYNTVDMSRRAMEETYFPPYQAAIDAGARTVMTAFNEVDGIPASANQWLLDEILRKKWGFDGVIVTDYTAVSEMVNHGTSADAADAARQAILATVDLDMVSEAFLTNIPNLVEAGLIDIETIDRAVTRILELKWDLGLFENPYARCTTKAPSLTSDGRPLAKRAALESIVLLQNHDQLLPLAKKDTIAVIGSLAQSRADLLGCWSAAGDPSTAITILEGIKTTAGNSTEIIYHDGSNIEEALTLTKAADTIILVLGETRDMSGEAASRADIRLPKHQRKLARSIYKTSKPCVLVTLSGRPLELTRQSKMFPTILHAWAPGIEGGNAIAEILFGHAAPVGKLAMSFPRHVGQLPMSYREKPTGRPYDPLNSYTSRYLDVANTPLFPFGHGLTYGVLEFTEPKIQETPGGQVVVTSLVTNPSTHSVTETFQLYLRDCVASVTRPLLELRNFRRVTLAPGASSEVSFVIQPDDLTFPGPDFAPIIEAGLHLAFFGTSAVELKQVAFHVPAHWIPSPAKESRSPLPRA